MHKFVLPRNGACGVLPMLAKRKRIKMFIAQLISPKGEAVFYPKGFGFTCHAWATSAEGAELFETEAKARQRVLAVVQPPAFWECERRHAQLMREKYGCHTIQVVKL